VRQIERVRHCDLDTLEEIGPARIFGALTRQTQTLGTSVAPILAGAQSAISVVFAMAYLAWLDLAALLLTLAIVGIGYLVYMSRLRRARAMLAEANLRENEVFDSITDLIDGFKEVRLHSARSADLAAFIDEISRRSCELRTSVDLKLLEVYLFSQLIFLAAGGALVFLLPGFGLTDSEELLKTITVIIFLFGPIGAMTAASSAVANAQASCEILLDLERKLDQAARPSQGEVALPFSGFEEIELRHVIYTHAREAGGFMVGPIDLSIRRGEILFISGGNGSGKSTLLKLLTALYLPQQGQVLVDGKVVDARHREACQNLFSTVFSDFHLFQRLFGLGEVDAADVLAWLTTMEIEKKTGMHERRFDTLKLSTGQRKRLAFVVAALEDRPIYVFDEFAADQDPAFRRKFYEEILPALHVRGKTVIVVTHDDRYFDRATRHVVMNEGRLSGERRSQS
jgi:putative ATP-binding cassette transporter